MQRHAHLAHVSGVTPRLLLGLIVVICSVSCRQAENVATRDDRRGQQSLTLTVTEAPGDWELIPGGRFRLAGIIETQEGLDAEEPCVVKVTDLLTGFRTERVVMTSTNDMLPGTTTPLFPNTLIPLEGGSFVLDAQHDYRIASEGYKKVVVEFKDSRGEIVTWEGSLNVPPRYQEISRESMVQARRLYGVRLLPLLSKYRQFLINLEESGQLDPVLLENLTYDLEVGRVLEETFTELLIVRADMRHWNEVADSLVTRLSDLESLGGSVSPQELAFRKGVTETGQEYGRRIRRDFEFASSFQWFFGSSSAGSGDLAPDLYLWKRAFLRHTHGQAQIIEDPEVGSMVFQARIFADAGNHPGAAFDRPPYAEPLLNTWQNQPPLMDLSVWVEDTDEDGLRETLRVSGTINQQPLETVLMDPIVSGEHLLAPLLLYELCEYWKPVAGGVI
ncbi:MAG: hypothetical protein GEEBNDBF_02292 [bacterium]|nr:hypothetical protein [bacterium]